MVRCMRCMHLYQQGICPVCNSSPDSVRNLPHQLATGTRLSKKYIVGAALGQGGFGITYVGWDDILDLKVAIKELFPMRLAVRDTSEETVHVMQNAHRPLFESIKQAFLDEARTLARFNDDPSVVSVREYFEANGTAYIVMDFIDGLNMGHFAAEETLSPEQVLSMIRPLFPTLSRVHEAGLLHRDISPDNIMIMKDQRIKLVDFGAARSMSLHGEESNTVNVKDGYAPEEQYRTHGKQGPWTDVYALGATIYRLLTGVKPPQSLERMGEDLLQPPSGLCKGITKAQETAVLRALAVLPENRFQSIGAFETALYGDVVTELLPHTPRKPSPLRSRGKTKRRIITACAAGLVMLAGGIAVVMMNFGAMTGSITLEPIEYMLIGDQKTVVQHSSPFPVNNERLGWHSSDESVVVITPDGTLIAKNEGNAFITVSSLRAEEMMRIDIHSPIEVIEGVESAYRLGVHDTVSILPRCAPESASEPLSYRSLNPDIATIDKDGVLYGETPGKTTIQVLSKNVAKSAEVEVFIPAVLSVLDVPNALGEGETFDFTYTVNDDATYGDLRIETEGALRLMGSNLVLGDLPEGKDNAKGWLVFSTPQEGELKRFEVAVTNSHTWIWSNQAVFVNKWYNYPIEFAAPVEDCTGFTYSFVLEPLLSTDGMKDVSSELENSTFHIYIRNEGDNWIQAKSFEVGKAGDTSVVQVAFEPQTIAGIICVPMKNDLGGSYRTDEWLSDIKVAER